MKEKYKTPYIYVEDLEKSDVLMASSSIIDPTQPTSEPSEELENAYRDISQFIFSGSWFD